MVDSSSVELLQEINSKSQKPLFWPWVLGLGACIVGALAVMQYPAWLFLLVIPLSAAGVFWAVYSDKMRKTVVLFYELEPHLEEVYQSLHNAFDALKACSQVWRVQSEGRITTTYDWKTNAGASSLVKRSPVRPRAGSPSYFETNISIPVLPAGGQVLYFLPDRILVWASNGVGAVSYEQLSLECREQRFVEVGSVPGDSKIVDKRWKYMNKSGGPDRRFNDNREIPVVLYDEMRLTSSSGLHEVFQISRTEVGVQLKAAVSRMASAISTPDQPTAENCYVKCPCNHCDVLIEFPARGLGETVTCPHCGLQTLLCSPGSQLTRPESEPEPEGPHYPEDLQVPLITPRSVAPPPIYPEAGIVRPVHQPRLRMGPLRWISPGESITVGGYDISSGLIYVCDGEPEPDEASAINTRLSIGPPASGDQARLGYYSQYRFISPSQRGAYLEWLAAGRGDKDAASRDLGYVFLFFYGVERRLLVDGAEDQEAIAELVRLLHHYGRGRSLQSYVCQLIHFWGWKQGPDYYAKLRDWMDTLPVSLLGADEMAIALASLHNAGTPLSATLAYDLASRQANARRSVIIKRVNEEFRALFAKRYGEEFPGGMPLRCAKAEAELEYRPASPTLLQVRYRQGSTFAVKVPDVLGTQSQFKPLVTIWDSCVEDLARYSRAKAKNGAATDFKAYVALPEQLRRQTPHPLADHWETVLGNARRENGCLIIEAGEAAEIIEISKRTKMTLGQSRELAQAIESLGYGVEPDSRQTNLGYAWDQEIGVFRPKAGPLKASSPTGLGAKSLLELCVFIAGADGNVSDEELAVSRNFIQNQLALTPEDNERLDVIQQVFISDPSTAKGSLNRIARRVPMEQREKIAQLLVTLAAADNVVTKDELRALEQVFKTFELSREKLDQFLRAIRPEFGEVTVEHAGERVPGEPIPAADFRLDMSRVATITRETTEVIAILSSVMAEAEDDQRLQTSAAKLSATPGSEPELAEAPPALAEKGPAWLTELRAEYQPVLQKLIERASWSRCDFDSLVKSFRLMPLDAQDAINEWSDEHLGDFLLEGEDPVQINRRLLPTGETTDA